MEFPCLPPAGKQGDVRLVGEIRNQPVGNKQRAIALFFSMLNYNFCFRQQPNEAKHDHKISFRDMQQILKQFTAAMVKASNGQAETAKSVVHQFDEPC
ncbi:hypothetical protein D3C78_1313430 [compost metagenome]